MRGSEMLQQWEILLYMSILSIVGFNENSSH